jgi:hypothetical protein
MSNPVRAWIGPALLLALAIGCSKSVAPRPPAPAVDPAGDAVAQDAAHPGFLVRLHFVGSMVTLDRAFQPQLHRNESFYVYSNGTVPLDPFRPDTIPANALLQDVRWRRTPGDNPRNDTDQFFDNGQVRSAGVGLPFASGLHIVSLRIPERLGGGEAQAAFQVDFPPEAVWWPGPDPALFPRSTDGDGRAVDVVSWARFSTVPAWPPDGRGYFGPDSFRVVPPQRRPVGGDFDRRTFYELFGDRIYARSEGDTVHFGAWVVFALGGFDRDSPYVPQVRGPAPTLPPGFESSPDRYSVLIAQGLIGSPIGFRIQVPVRLPGGQLLLPSETTTFPNFDVLSVFYSPQVAGYWRMDFAGKAYAIAHAQDSEGFVDREGGDDLVALADRVDAGGGTAEDHILRRHVLTFFVRGGTPVASN